MSSPYELRINRVMDHVRQRFAEELSLEGLARVACFSPFHFHRIFKAGAGETLNAFIQRVRLERACYLMMAAPRRSLGSIALEVGFCAQSDLSRVFKQRYGIAPSAWDRRSRLDERGIDGYEAALAAARAASPPPTVVLRRHPPCRLAYVRLRTPFMGDVLRVGYAQLTAWLDARGVDWRRSRLLGLSWDNFETTPLDQVRFDFGFEVGPHIEAEGEVGVYELPGVRAADVHCQGPLSTIALAWEHLYDRWLPTSGFEPDELPGIKRFRRRPDEIGWDQWDVDCSIAIRPLGPL